MTDERCPCGEVHELSERVRGPYERIVGATSPFARITTSQGTWLVPKIWIAVHGLQADLLPALAEEYGFERQP